MLAESITGTDQLFL